MANSVVFKPDIHVGEISAEDDEFFLADCFVELPIFHQLLDFESSKSIVVGRTGSGKTAILKKIEEKKENTIRIDPKEIAFDYISNSNIINTVIELGCDINILFELLWKHILISKIIKEYFKSRSMFEKTLDLLNGQNLARAYFDKYQGSFWQEQDQVLSEISGNFEAQLNTSLEAGVGPERFASIKSGVSSNQSLTTTEKKEFQTRVKKAVSDLQIRELNVAIDSLNNLMSNRQRTFIIIIDDLDSSWAEPAIQYKLIHALIDTIKNFRKLRTVKVIAAIRSDVYEKSITEFTRDGIQPEKYDSITVNVQWNTNDLFKMLNSRISYMFKKRYSKNDAVVFKDIFPASIRKIDAFNYICERTLMRPRDLIFFFNMMLDQAAGTTQISQKNVIDVESEYSRKRLEALKIEWRSVHVKIDSYISLLKQQTGKKELRDLVKREILTDICLELSELEGTDYYKDECYRSAMHYIKAESPRNLLEFSACILSVLYKIGAIQIKLSKEDTYYACYKNGAIVDPVQITEDAAFTVSPMLWRSLGITPNI